jgi:GT2 family glycosyltransferase
VILPTRNRPALFRRALESVLQQSFTTLEVLVVNDGSAAEFLPEYKAMEAASDARVRWFYQPWRANGHGPSYSINTGAQAARGHYLCILDDDDSWDAADHLHRAHAAISARPAVDLYYSNQRAYRADGSLIEQPLWLAALLPRLAPGPAGAPQTSEVTPAFLLSCNGFPHLNCTIIRRQLYLDIGGMDEGIRYECEVDLYLRSLQAAGHILYNPAFIARHNVPDAARQNNVSTAVGAVDKRLSQIGVYQKNLARAPAPAIRDACLSRLAMLYKQLAQTLAGDRHYVIAAAYARMALAHRYSVKWQLYCLYLGLLATIRD